MTVEWPSSATNTTEEGCRAWKRREARHEERGGWRRGTRRAETRARQGKSRSKQRERSRVYLSEAERERDPSEESRERTKEEKTRETPSYIGCEAWQMSEWEMFERTTFCATTRTSTVYYTMSFCSFFTSILSSLKDCCKICLTFSFCYAKFPYIRVRDGNGPGGPRAGPGLKIQARRPYGPKRA